MALVRINAGERPPAGDDEALARALEALAPGAPLVVMIHGFRFQPGLAGQCPHDHILALRPPPGAGRAVSWPRHLGLAAPEAGLAVAFGWPARGSLPAAYRRAAGMGESLAEVVGRLRRLAPDRPVDVIAHSLGARVALQALPLLAPGDIGRMILMACAEFQGPAAAAIDSPAGRAAEVLNVVSRENDLFDLVLETCMAGGMRRTVAAGLPHPREGWADLQIDHREVLAGLGRLGFRLGAPTRTVCHWSPYLRPGIFALYRAWLGRRIGLAALRASQPAAPDPRWSRLWQALPIRAGAGAQG